MLFEQILQIKNHKNNDFFKLKFADSLNFPKPIRKTSPSRIYITDSHDLQHQDAYQILEKCTFLINSLMLIFIIEPPKAAIYGVIEVVRELKWLYNESFFGDPNNLPFLFSRQNAVKGHCC